MPVGVPITGTISLSCFGVVPKLISCRAANIAMSLLCELFPMCGFVSMLHNTHGAARRHNLRFVDRCVGDQIEQFSRRLFGLVRMWKDLPVYIVEITSVKAFHSKLKQCARKACEEDAVGWAFMYSTDSFPRHLIWR